MRASLLLALLGASLPAHAARHELSFEHQGQFFDDGPAYSVFRVDRHEGYGLRGGYAVLRDRQRLGLVVDAAWSHARQDASVWRYAFDEDEGEAYESGSTTSARWSADTVLVGLKGDVDVGNVWYPYVHAQTGLIALGAVLDDPEAPAEARVRDTAVVPVGQFTLGFELMIPDRKLGWPVTAAIFFEAGYQAAGPARFDTFGGPVELSGALVRSGVGLRM